MTYQGAPDIDLGRRVSAQRNEDAFSAFFISRCRRQTPRRRDFDSISYASGAAC